MHLRPALFAASLLLGAPLIGCATKPPASEPEALAEYRQTNDPLEPTNRFLYKVNNAIDAVVLKPVAVVYRYGVPEPLRNGIHNILANLTTPVVLANNLMQGRPGEAGDTAMRFLINTTVGAVGFFDVASGWGYKPHDTDFGITMALWGVPDGPFLFLPVLGPSDPRDATGYGVDIALDPLTYVGQGATVVDLKYTRYSLSAADARASVLGTLDSIKRTALDPYATFRSLYRQHRESEIEAARHPNQAQTEFAPLTPAQGASTIGTTPRPNAAP